MLISRAVIISALILANLSVFAAAKPAIILNNITNNYLKKHTHQKSGQLSITSNQGEFNLPTDEWLISEEKISLNKAFVYLKPRFGHWHKVELPKRCLKEISLGQIFEITGLIDKNGKINDLNCQTKIKNAN